MHISLASQFSSQFEKKKKLWGSCIQGQSGISETIYLNDQEQQQNNDAYSWKEFANKVRDCTATVKVSIKNIKYIGLSVDQIFSNNMTKETEGIEYMHKITKKL